MSFLLFLFAGDGLTVEICLRVDSINSEGSLDLSVAAFSWLIFDIAYLLLSLELPW